MQRKPRETAVKYYPYSTFRAYQRQMTLHGVRVMTKLYFAIFAAFEVSMTLNLAQRSFKVIHYDGNRKPVYDYRPLIVTFALSSTVSEILPVLYSPSKLCK